MRFAANRPFSDPDKAARRLVEIANGVEPAQDGRIYIEPPMRPAGDGTGGTKAAAAASSWQGNHRAVVGAPVTPGVPTIVVAGYVVVTDRRPGRFGPPGNGVET
jgi:hypothetical protein